jgi:uncharacterized membrane protein
MFRGLVDRGVVTDLCGERSTAADGGGSPRVLGIERMRLALCWLLGLLMILAGVNHFLDPDVYTAMMPKALPAPVALVYVSGVAEILVGAGLLVPATRRLAAWGLVALLVAVFPANINMAVNHLPLGDTVVPVWALWARLPLQFVLIYWAWCYTRPASDPAAQR